MVVEIPVTEARAQFADLINRVGYGGEEIVLTRHGKSLVALIPASAIEARPRPRDEVVLDVTSQRDDSQARFVLAAQERTPQPFARE